VSQDQQVVSTAVADAPSGPAGQHLLQVGWRHKSLVALGVVVGLTLGILYYSQRPPVYQSAAQVLVVKKRPDATGVVGQPIPVEDYVATHQVLIKSPLIIERAIQKRSLGSFRSLAQAGDDATEAIIKALTVNRNKTSTGNSNVLELSLRGGVAGECAEILKAVIESYKDFLDETYRNMSDDTLALVTRARDVLQKDLADKEEAYREFRKTTPALWKGKDGTTLRQDRLLEIESKRSALVLRRAEIEAQLAAVESAKKDGKDRDVLLAMASEFTAKAESDDSKNSSASALHDQLLAQLIEEQSLLQRYGAGHPDVQAVRKRIETAREFLSKPGSTYAKAAPSRTANDNESRPPDALELHLQYLRQKLRQVNASEQLLADLFRKEDEEGRKLAGFEIQEEGLRTNIARTQQLYDSLIKRLQDVGLVRDVGGYDARTIAPPLIGRKVAPNALLVFPLACLLGLLGGLGLAYAAEAADKSFRTPEEIRRRLGLPIVGHIPYLASLGGRSQLPVPDGAILDPLLYAFHKPRSSEAEAFRGVRTALYFSTHGERHQVIQITSPDGGDGKTTIAANLAISMAQSGQKTVLIDADFRKPRQQRIFGISSGIGLAGVLEGQAEVADEIRSTNIPGLSILPCGFPPPNPAELLTGPRLNELLNVLRDRYDFILIDTPPILAVTDPCVVAPRVDGVLLVIRLSSKARPHAERAREILATLGARVLGVLVNGMDSAGHASPYGYGHYGYGSPYGDATEDAGLTNGNGVVSESVGPGSFSVDSSRALPDQTSRAGDSPASSVPRD
jgi:capsular exopolysaccharide synthesis family protein